MSALPGPQLSEVSVLSEIPPQIRSPFAFLLSMNTDAALRRIVQLSMATVVAGLTLATFMIGGAENVPGNLLFLDLLAITVALVPWHRLPRDAFVLTGVAAVLSVAVGVSVGDPMRARLIPFTVALGAGAVSQRAGLAVGILGAAIAFMGLGREETMNVLASATGSLFCGVVIPGLTATARARRDREPVAPSALSDYVAVLAHEVSTPIVSIGAAAQVLAKELRGRAAERNALAIAEEARQVYALLESLSDLSALETGRLRLSLRDVDIAALIRGGFGLVELNERQLVIDAPEDPVHVAADDRRIRQVLRNLLANAVKYSEAGTQIEVRVGRTSDGGSAIIQVRDHGPGIPPAERKHLFEKFRRLSTAGGTRGSGLGLFLSREIVVDHGGEMWAEWPAGGGSVFAFTLPLARPRVRRADRAVAAG